MAENAGEAMPLGRRLPVRLPARLLARLPTLLPARLFWRLATPTLAAPTLRLFRLKQQSHRAPPLPPPAPGGGSRGSANRIRLALKPTTPQQKANASVAPYSISTGMVAEAEEKGGSSVLSLLPLLTPFASIAGH